MSLVRFAATDLLRNRRRTLSSLVGVLLAVTFIAGTLIAIDSSAHSLLDAYLADVTSDFSLETQGPNVGFNWSAAQDALRVVPGVTDVAMYRPVPLAQVFNPASNASQLGLAGQVWAIEPDHLPYSLRGASVNGSLVLNNRTAALGAGVATELRIPVGGEVGLLVINYNPATGLFSNSTVNLTVSAIVTPSSYVGILDFSAFVNLSWAPVLEAELHLGPQFYLWSGDIWINRDRFILPYDPDGTQRNLVRLERTMDAAIGTYGVTVQDNDLGPLNEYASSLDSERLLFMLMSAPVALLGLYLGAVGVDLGHAERRRELAVLRCRGASPRQILSLLLFEALLGGLAATVLGLLAGVAVSRALLAVTNPVGAAYVPDYADVFLSVNTVAIVLGLSVGFMAAVSYSSARRTAQLPLVETLRFYAPGETRLYYSKTGDLAIVAYSVIAYVFVAFYRPSTADLWTFLLTFFFYTSMPFAPLFLILGATRLATRSTGKVYEATAKASRPFSRDLEYLIGRGLARNPRRASNVAIIIALGLAFGIFAVSIFGSIQAYQDRIIRSITGSDVKAVAPFDFRGNYSSALAALPGISGVTAVGFGAGTPTWGYAMLVSVDPDSYFPIVRPESFYFGNMSASDAQSDLEQPGLVLVTQTFANDVAVAVGDMLPLQVSYENKTQVTKTVNATVVVAGIVDFLPGTSLDIGFSPQGPSYPPGSGILQAPPEVYGNPATFAALWHPADRMYNLTGNVYIASLAPGADWRAVKQEIQGLGGLIPPLMYQEIVDAVAESPQEKSLSGFLDLEIAFIVLILTVGLGLIVYAASREREVEFAGIIARGATGWQTTGLLVGEAFSVLVIGLVAGTVVGLLSGYLYDPFLFSTLSLGPSSAVVPFLFEFPMAGYLLLVGAAGAILLGSAVVSWRIARMDVARVLKLRGG